MEGIFLRSANFVPLSTTSLLEKPPKICRDRTSVIYGSLKHKWSKIHQALTQLRISRGDVNSELGSLESMEGMLPCSANFVPLSPISFLERAAKICRHRNSVVYGSLKYNWGETYQRCLKLASALTLLGISRGDVVATLLPNVPAMYELHFAVPMAGAVLCTLNSRLDERMVSILLEHSQAKVLSVDYQFLCIAQGALDMLAKATIQLPILVLVTDSVCPSTIDTTSVSYEYEKLLALGHDEFKILRTNSELDPISINYTSGTTSRPKGVVFSHRGAYLNSLATVLLFEMGFKPVYLWTVPMFHSNGWCLPGELQHSVGSIYASGKCLQKAYLTV
ncbi:hypothetical protein L6164_020239 [Bauhinia variegata]|uniref:Uncharacterized protein n=1 Tax=Bauhinia variegata TaxID=167791 RepID=A0ACB9MUF2_BAUVA|nr:hypothetical protein L6164_020239 [Bauhinia variegata]